MPNSSRRKQSKPQHVPNEDSAEGEKSVAGSQSVTSSSHETGDQSTQEVEYGSKVTGTNGDAETDPLIDTNLQRGGDFVVENGISVSDSEDEKMVEQNADLEDSLPHDLSLKPKVKDTSEDDLDLEEELYCPPSEQVRDRFCVHCNVVLESPADLELHLQQHTGERPFHCPSCEKQFKSKRSLQFHEYTQHSTNSTDSNIAQSCPQPGKRQLELTSHEQPESLVASNTTSTSQTPVHSPTYQVNSPNWAQNTQPTTESPASKRQRLGEPGQPLYSSAITPTTSESIFDLRMVRSADTSFKGSSYEGSDPQEAVRGCPVCAKTFPKPSDLKRHMMCHTGEKPFRCQYCNKPFRAKSSMHYHLKATHGLEIELSPGLEERYLRMKTRAQMNVVQRGSLNSHGAGYHYGSDNGDRFPRDIDIDELEDDSKSTDSSFYQNSGIGSVDTADTKSQGHYSNTGNEYKSAIDLTMSDKSTKQVINGGFIVAEEGPFRRKKMRIRNETVLITRLDGLDLARGTTASVYKCYLCSKMFNSLSKMQCHLSLHFERQVTSYECCFCEEIFTFKSQLQNHMRRRHSALSSKTKNQTETQRCGPDNRKSSTNKFTCTYCHKSFNTKISLHKHTRLHFWNRNCFCRICGKSFNQYTSLQLHISRFHWKTAGKMGTTTAGTKKKLNFFNAPRSRFINHDGIPKHSINEPLDLIKDKTYQNDAQMPISDVTIVMPQSPPIENGDMSDGGLSHNSSENNWSESLSDNPGVDIDDSGKEIRSAPRRYLLPFRGESSSRGRASRKSTPTHFQPHNQVTSDNNVPLNYIKAEMCHQDTNNNENHRLSPDKAPLLSSSTEALIPGYNLNATSHLMMAKALAAHQSLTQHLNHTSQPLLYPPNHLPPSLAAMSQMMSLPVAIPSSSSAEPTASTSKSPSPASYTSSRSDTSPDDKETRESLVGYPRVQWGQKAPDWTFNMYCPPETNHTDGRKVTSLSRTHSRLGIVHSPVNRESLCKPSVLTDGRTVYKCPFCSKEFVSFSDINRHMDFHEDIRPYKCQYCDYFARTNSQLKVHMMRHQGIREFCCKLCNYKGVTQSDLNRHMKSQIHMLKSRNACQYCGEGFVTSKNLEKHLDGNCIVKMQKLNGGLDIPMQAGIV